MKRTSTTSNALLGLLSLRPAWPTYQLTKQLRRNMRFFWPRAESRIYDGAKRLVDQGLAKAGEEHVGHRARTIYSITAAGREQVARWLATPPRGTILECEPLLRVFLADLCTHEQLAVALDQIRADAEAILEVGRVVGPEYLEGTSPLQDQVHARALVFDFLWNHAQMLRQWVERSDAMMDHWNQLTPSARADEARELIRRNLKDDPLIARP